MILGPLLTTTGSSANADAAEVSISSVGLIILASALALRPEELRFALTLDAPASSLRVPDDERLDVRFIESDVVDACTLLRYGLDVVNLDVQLVTPVGLDGNVRPPPPLRSCR